MKTLPVLPPQILLEDEIAAIPDYDAKVASTVSNYPPIWSAHPVVASSRPGEVVTPLALYFDGIGYTKRDSVHGFFVINMVTGTRHLVCEMRKRDQCRCGCRGWCSLLPIFQFLHRCFLFLATGLHASDRHDGKAFLNQEVRLNALAGTACRKAAVLYIKADLMEFGSSLGFPTTASKDSPCLFCKSTKR